MKKRVLIVDDSPFVRRILTDWISSSGDLEVAGTAVNGQEGFELALKLKPDLITLDVEMPVMDGLQALERIMKDAPVPVVMVSSVTKKGAAQTLKALELGAVDFVTKPDGPASIRLVNAKDEILLKLRGAMKARFVPGAVNRPARPLMSAPAVSDSRTDKVVMIASSTGGPKALTTLISSLPKGFPAPMVIVQHMPEGFTESFARRLDGLGKIAVKEAAEGDRIMPGLALLAPGGKHLFIKPDHTIGFHSEPHLHGVRPAADYMLKSAAQIYGARCLGVILTGMGRDGAEGMKQIRNKGGIVLGESEASCVIYGMPKAAKEIGAVQEEFAIEEMGAAVVGCLNRRRTYAA